jgi:Tol biopolymer transport system component
MRRTYLGLVTPLLPLACDDASAPPASGAAHATPPALMTIPILPKIAFASDRDGDNDIYSIAPDGGTLVKVTDSEDVEETQPAWDRRVRVSFTTDRYVVHHDENLELGVVPRNGGAEERLTISPEPDTYGAWSPDGSKLAFTSERSGNSDVWVIDFKTKGVPKQLTRNPGFDGHPAWDGSGSYVVYSSDSGSTVRRIWRMSATGTGKSPVTYGLSDDDFPNWDWHSDRVVFASDLPGDVEIYSINVNGFGLRRLTMSSGVDTRPSFSPSGNQIAFESHRDGNAEVYVMSREGGSPANVTNDPSDDTGPAWSH